MSALPNILGCVLAVSPWAIFLGSAIWLNGRFDWLASQGKAPQFMPMKRLDIYSTAAWILTSSHRALDDRATTRAVWLARACMPFLPITLLFWLSITDG
jgi:hypothetical protein